MDNFGEVESSNTYNVIKSNGKTLLFNYSDVTGSYGINDSCISIRQNEISMSGLKFNVDTRDSIDIRTDGTLNISTTNDNIVTLGGDVLQIYGQTHFYEEIYSYKDVSNIEDQSIVPNKGYVDNLINNLIGVGTEEDMTNNTTSLFFVVLDE